MTNTRIKLTWYAVIALTGIAIFAIFKGAEGTATTSVGGILAVVAGYQGSRAWTKTTAMKNNKEDAP